jgi:hypothetical protein
MTTPPSQARTDNAAVRRWSNLWIAAIFTFGTAGLLQWVVLPPGGTLAEIARGIEIAAIVVGIGGLFRWAVMRERNRRQSPSKDVGDRKQ